MANEIQSRAYENVTANQINRPFSTRSICVRSFFYRNGRHSHESNSYANCKLQKKIVLQTKNCTSEEKTDGGQ